ncbi:gibberellin 2-beta-dioxygenase 8-like [Gossypium australe]|uniref:Gibberellin 2-beta-dioxygenase 8-like n=1 Tax=Gossypium australe TaxID=47621 RepID=A0A5B6VRL6_9ROSI|nr:gibberellin 2-beta-dioxygenase 8-like [Gossypium australe]
MNNESYPPLFNQQSNQTQIIDIDEPIQDVEDLDLIPNIDLQCLNCDKLEEACKNWDLFRLINHGIPSKLMTQIQDQARNLFCLSFEHKQSILSSPLSYFWGTTFRAISRVALRSPNTISWVKIINFPLVGLLEFKSLIDEYGRHQARLARTIYESMAKNHSLDLRPSESYLSELTGFIRVHRYPQIPKGNQAWGVGVHTASTVLSILNPDQLGGLQVFKDNKWIPVKPIADSLIINLGDMMQSKCEEVRGPNLNKLFCVSTICTIQSSKYNPFT